jgi:hypothetical protein
MRIVEIAVAAVNKGERALMTAVRLVEERRPRGFTYTISFCRR